MNFNLDLREALENRKAYQKRLPCKRQNTSSASSDTASIKRAKTAEISPHEQNIETDQDSQFKETLDVPFISPDILSLSKNHEHESTDQTDEQEPQLPKKTNPDQLKCRINSRVYLASLEITLFELAKDNFYLKNKVKRFTTIIKEISKEMKDLKNALVTEGPFAALFESTSKAKTDDETTEQSTGSNDEMPEEEEESKHGMGVCLHITGISTLIVSCKKCDEKARYAAQRLKSM